MPSAPQKMRTLETTSKEPVFSIERLNTWYGRQSVLRNVSLAVPARTITALIGPSGCGKSTFLRVLNRLNDLVPGFRKTGQVFLENQDIYARDVDVTRLRTRVGMVFQRPQPFPMSIFENVAYGPRIQGMNNKTALLETVEASLRAAFLWNEVRDRLHQNALSLSGGQQQRLCIARALAVNPQVLLMDEPTSALDPAATARIEELMDRLRQRYTLIVVTHSMQQAARISQHTAFLLNGQLVEFGPTRDLFTHPRDQRTEDYVTGRFG